MKAVQIVKPEELKVIDIEKPVIDEKNNVLVKMTAVLIWGSTMAPMRLQPIQGSLDMKWWAALTRSAPMLRI